MILLLWTWGGCGLCVVLFEYPLVSVASCSTHLVLPVPVCSFSKLFLICWFKGSVSHDATSCWIALQHRQGENVTGLHTPFQVTHTLCFRAHAWGAMTQEVLKYLLWREPRGVEYCLWNCWPTLFILRHDVVIWTNAFFSSCVCSFEAEQPLVSQREEAKSPMRSISYCQVWVMTHSSVALVDKRFCGFEEAHSSRFFHI